QPAPLDHVDRRPARRRAGRTLPPIGAQRFAPPGHGHRAQRGVQAHHRLVTGGWGAAPSSLTPPTESKLVAASYLLAAAVLRAGALRAGAFLAGALRAG